MDSDDKHILGGLRNGDRTAAVSVIEQSYQRIYAFLRRLTFNDNDAADLTQRTFSRVWQALPTFAGRSSFSSWIHGIAYHVYVDWRRVDRHADSKPDEWWLACPSDAAGPDETAARADLAAQVYSSVDRLEQDLRNTMHLHYYQGLTIEETAEAMGVATSTVKYRRRLALAELKKALAEPVLGSVTRGKTV
jgi:RNA polymerase sigma-70 factor, ECF subfamily